MNEHLRLILSTEAEVLALERITERSRHDVMLAVHALQCETRMSSLQAAKAIRHRLCAHGDPALEAALSNALRAERRLQRIFGLRTPG